MNESAATTNETLTAENKVIKMDNTAPAKNDIWEGNHNLIAETMSAFMRMHERMPTKTELAEATGLSRPTIYAHLHECAQQPEIQQQESELRMLYSKLLARMYTYAMNGDVQAAKLYINTVERMKENSLNHD